MIDSRPADDGAAIRRRRACPECAYRFTTYERLEEAPLLVMKRSGSPEPFDRAKVTFGVRSACKGRPVDDAAIDARHLTEERVARKRARWEKIRAEEVGIIVVIQPTHIVLTKAILPAAQASPALPSAGVEAETRAVAGAPNTIVHRPGRRVGHVLRLTATRPVVGRDDRAHIGDARALGVLIKK